MRDFKGNHIAVLGMSIEGWDSVRFLHSRGAVITCCDRRGKDALGPLYRQASSLGVSFQLGESYLNRLRDFDMVVRTPGMSPRLPELVAYVEAGGTMTSLTKLFFAECRAPIIGVTGTKGKGTTSTLIAAMLKAGGKSVHLGGNVGTPLLSRVDAIKPDDWVVLELSSFQLEDLTQSPHIAVVLKTTQEHLANFDTLATNFHPTRHSYIQSKTSIVRYQTDRDTVIVNKDDPTSSSFSDMTKAKRLSFSSKDPSADAFVTDEAVQLRTDGKTIHLVDRKSVKLLGHHNLENIAAAALTAQAIGIGIPAIRTGATTFAGLEHRLELVRRVGGVSYYNDSFSTVPETAIAAIRSFDRPIVLIVGGSEKGSDFADLGTVIARSRVRAIIVIGAMTGRILKAMDDGGFTGRRITGLGSMQDIVQCAKKEAHSGDVVLLSPACASFDMFPNYKVRGKQFKDEVAKIIPKS